MSSVGTSTGTQDANIPNIIINGTEVTGEEAMNQLMKKSDMGGNAITSISYTKGGAQITLEGDSLEEFLETMDAVFEVAKAGGLSDEDIRALSKSFQNLLVAFFDVVVEIVEALGGTNDEVTPESAEFAEEVQKAVENFLNSKIFSDADMRELMKLLIKAFAQLLNSQRAIDLAAINIMIDAFNSKIEAMEQSRDAEYKAAMTEAITKIITGVLQVGMAIFSMIGAAGREKSASASATPGAAKVAGNEDDMNGGDFLAQLIKAGGEFVEGASGMIAAGYKYDAASAKILAEKADAILKVVEKMLDSGSKNFDELKKAINDFLSTLKEILQGISSTEMQVAAQKA